MFEIDLNNLKFDTSSLTEPTEEIIKEDIKEVNKIELEQPIIVETKKSLGIELEIPSESEVKELHAIKGIDIVSNLTSKEINPTLLQKDEVNKEEESIVIELNKEVMVTKLQLDTIKDLLSKDGDITVYLKYGENSRKLGIADSSRIYRIIIPVMSTLFGADATIYKKSGTKYKKYSENDMSVLKINMR